MPPDSSFEKYRSNYEQKSVRRQIFDAQINVVELFYDRLLSEAEAESIAAALANVQDQQGLELLKQKMDEQGILDLHRLDYEEENEVAVRILRDSFQEKITLLDSGNWKLLFTEFVGQTTLRHPSVFQELLVKGWLSRLLERAYSISRQEGLEALSFSTDVTDVLGRTGNLPDFLAANTRVIAGKRQPAFLESIEATLERLALIEHLPEVFGENVEGIIVGGSLGYGPFYNVRKNIDATGSSDIDILCVLSQREKTAAWEGLSRTDLFAPADSQGFIQRTSVFDGLRGRGVADVISQRFRITGKDFTMSAHFFPADFFSEMNEKRLGFDLARNEDIVFSVLDYKANRFEHSACVQQSFDGEDYSYVVPNQAEVEHGVIAKLPGYIIAGGRFYPGLYQNLLSPEFAVFHDATGFTGGIVKTFQNLLRERMQKEKQVRSSSVLTKSHIRNRVFAPERYLD